MESTEDTATEPQDDGLTNDPPKDDRRSVNNRECESNPIPTINSTAVSATTSNDEKAKPSSRRKARSRGRKRRKWKPYSQLTWKEKLELEKRDLEKMRRREQEEDENEAAGGDSLRPPRTPRLTMEVSGASVLLELR